MVFGKATVRGPHEAAHWQVEARRTELPLIVAIRRKLHDLVLVTRRFQDVRHHAVDFSVAATALLVGRPTWIAKTGQHEPMPDSSYPVLVPSEPRDRPD